MHLCCMTAGREVRIKLKFHSVTHLEKTSSCDSQILCLFLYFINFVHASITSLSAIVTFINIRGEVKISTFSFPDQPWTVFSFCRLCHYIYTSCNREIMVNNVKETSLVDEWVLSAGDILCNFTVMFMAECCQHHKASNRFVFNVFRNGSHGNAHTHACTQTTEKI